MKKIIVLLIGSIDYDSRVQKEISNFISLGYVVTLFLWNWEPYKYKKKNVRIINAKLGNHGIRKKKWSFITRFLKFIIYWYFASKEVKKGNFKFIHCNDLITLGVIFFLPKRYHKNVIYDAHDLLPERYKRKGVKYYIWSLIENRLIRKIDTVIVPEINRGRYLKAKYKLHKIPFIINNYPIYQKINTVNIKKQLKLPNDNILLCYQGLIDKRREIENMVLSLKFIPERFILLLIGFAFGDYIIKLKRLVMEEQLQGRVFFYGKVS
ncbi:MAG: glycosyltransferase, partial [Candidatus Helarchaeota archaeon]